MISTNKKHIPIVASVQRVLTILCVTSALTNPVYKFCDTQVSVRAWPLARACEHFLFVFRLWLTGGYGKRESRRTPSHHTQTHSLFNEIHCVKQTLTISSDYVSQCSGEMSSGSGNVCTYKMCARGRVRVRN